MRMDKIDVNNSEFLRPEQEEIRHQIRGILDSYTHEWDILSEILQNSVDAIREKAAGKGHISLFIDASRGIIKVEDNGVGIDPTQITRLLRPFGTNKTNKPGQIGEKGVGLKFVMFSSAKFTILTKSEKGTCEASVADASSWLSSNTDVPLLLSVDPSPQKESIGTVIEIKLNDLEHPIFQYSFQELQFLIKTRTACGDTGWIWDNRLDADVVFSHINKNLAEKFAEFECEYLLPTSGINATDYISIDDFEAWMRERDRTDVEKRRKLYNKVVFAKGKQLRSGRDIRYWSCFVPKREFWRILSQNVGISFPAEDDHLPGSELGSQLGFSGGFETSTKGMPTGIAIEMKPRGSAGYVPNFFIIVDDPELRFDIGRKSIQSRQQGMLREIAYENFRDFINKSRKYMGGAVDPDVNTWDKDEIFTEIENLPDLNSEKTRFSKRPNSQEATVAAMYFEQIGRQEFQDITPLISGYKGRYDLYAKWRTRRVTIEFKFDLAGLLRDFSDERKLFHEINTVVLWEVTEQDHVLAARRAMTIDAIPATSFSKMDRFPGATKTLSLGDVSPISIVELKPLISGG